MQNATLPQKERGGPVATRPPLSNKATISNTPHGLRRGTGRPPTPGQCSSTPPRPRKSCAAWARPLPQLRVATGRGRGLGGCGTAGPILIPTPGMTIDPGFTTMDGPFRSGSSRWSLFFSLSLSLSFGLSLLSFLFDFFLSESDEGGGGVAGLSGGIGGDAVPSAGGFDFVGFSGGDCAKAENEMPRERMIRDVKLGFIVMYTQPPTCPRVPYSSNAQCGLTNPMKTRGETMTQAVPATCQNARSIPEVGQ